MDVKISYGIGLEQVPSKISSMLSRLNIHEVDQLINIATQLLNISEENAGVASGLIDQARLKMAELDRSLQDSQMILNGYIAAAETKEIPPETTGGTQDAD